MDFLLAQVITFLVLSDFEILQTLREWNLDELNKEGDEHEIVYGGIFSGEHAGSLAVLMYKGYQRSLEKLGGIT